MNFQISQKFDDSLTDIEYRLYDSVTGIPIKPDSATLAIIDGDTLLIGGGTVTIDADTDVVSYEFSASEVSNLIENLPNNDIRIEWTFVFGVDDYERVQYIDIRSFPFNSTVNDMRLTETWHALSQHRNAVAGIVESGTTTTMIDSDELSVYSGNFFAGSVMTILTGINKGQKRLINLFDRLNSEVTVDTAYSGNIVADDQYKIEISWNSLIKQALDQIESKLPNYLGYNNYLRLVDSEDIYQAHLHLSASLVAESLSQGRNDKFAKMRNDRLDSYNTFMDNILLKINNNIDSDGNSITKVNRLHTFGIARVGR